MKITRCLFILFIALAWAGCNSTEYRIKKFPERFAALTKEEQAAVQNKTLNVGQSAEVVYFIMGDPSRIKRQVKNGINKDIWVYTKIFTELEGTHLAGYERRVYYDAKYNVYRVYYVPNYVHEYSEHQEVVAEIEFEDGKVSAITEVES